MNEFRKLLRAKRKQVAPWLYEKLKKAKDIEEVKDVMIGRMFDGDYNATEEFLYHKVIFELS